MSNFITFCNTPGGQIPYGDHVFIDTDRIAAVGTLGDEVRVLVNDTWIPVGDTLDVVLRLVAGEDLLSVDAR